MVLSGWTHENPTDIGVEFVVARRQSVVGRSSDAAAERRDCFHRDAIGCPVNFGIVGVDV